MAPTTRLRSHEAASYLRLSPSTLAKLRCAGAGPQYFRAGPRIIVYEVSDLDQWLKSNCPQKRLSRADASDCAEV